MNRFPQPMKSLQLICASLAVSISLAGLAQPWINYMIEDVHQHIHQHVG